MGPSQVVARDARPPSPLGRAIRFGYQIGSRMTDALQRLSDSELVERWQRDHDAVAREEVVRRYGGFVSSLAARYLAWGEPFDDLVQVAWIGMLKAIDRFDTSRGLRLATYAAPTIVGEIRRHYRDRTSAVHVPRPMQELRVRANTLIDHLSAERGSSPTIGEVASLLGASKEEVLDALQTGLARSADSFTTSDAESGERSFEVAVEEAGFETVEVRATLERGLDGLSERERSIVALRFEDGLTQSQIAARLGISQMHVSRLLRQSLESLRGVLDEDEMG